MLSQRIALYARVSSEGQAEERTIDSQVAALVARIAQDGLVLDPEGRFLDEGYSGATLVRPALERMRDMAAAGAIDRLYVHSPDRLARRYAYQVLLLDELGRAGVEVLFLNRPIGTSPEDDLLLQVQGMVAEYERAKILERSRRGKRHAARSGRVNVFCGAPYGYRYVRPATAMARRATRSTRRKPKRSACVRLDRPGSPRHRRGLPAVAPSRVPDPFGQGGLGPHHGLGHAQEPGLCWLGGLRQNPHRPAATTAAPHAPRERATPPGPRRL